MGGILESGNEDSQPGKVDDVGKAFIEWAEQYWGFEKSFTLKSAFVAESAPYSVIRRAFIAKINELTELNK